MHAVGEEMCYQLSRMGAKLILSARNEQKLEEVKNSLAHPEDARYMYMYTVSPPTVKSRDCVLL